MEQKKLKKEKINNVDVFLKHYSRILLWIFIMVIMSSSIYILFNAELYCTKTVTYDDRFNEFEQHNNYIDDCKIISIEEMKMIKNDSIRYNIISVVCIIGMIIFNPDIIRKFRRYIKR